MKKVCILLLIACLLAVFFQTCYWEGTTGPGEDVEYPIPEEGKWYCDVLQVTLDLNSYSHKVNTNSSVQIDGEIIACNVGMEYNTPYIFLNCQEPENKNYSLGQSIYWWTFIEANETEMVLEDYKTGETYYFIRIDK